MANRWRSVLMAALLGVGGCGLSDYERHMDAERERVKLYDEENRVLGDAIEVPTEKAKETEEKPAWPFEVFLRLPAGVSGKVAGRYGSTVPLYRYAGQDMNVFVAAGIVAEKNKDGIYKPGEWIVDDFRTGVRAALKKFYDDAYKYNPLRLVQEQPVKDQRKPQSWRGGELPALDFDKYAGSDKENARAKELSSFEMYVYRVANRQIAIIYQYPERVSAEKQSGIDLSLKSLDISDSAVGRRNEAASYLAKRQGKRPS